MFCSKCGRKLPKNAKFCSSCGAPVEFIDEKDAATQNVSEHSSIAEVSEKTKGEKVTENIVLGIDGKYHWYYEFKLLRNPTILKLIWKIFFWIFVGIWLMIVLADTFGGRMDWDDFLDISKTFLIVLVGFEVVVALGYFIYAALQGFKYCVLFEMDEDGVKHTQVSKQFKKAQAVSFISMMMGAAAGKPGIVGTSMLAASRQSMFSTWSSVKSVEIIRKHNVIKVNERLSNNQVYAEDADFQFVESFIKSHVTKKCKIR